MHGANSTNTDNILRPEGGGKDTNVIFPCDVSLAENVSATVSCLFPQIEDGGVGVPRRATPLNRRRERRHSASLRATASTTGSKNHTRRCLDQFVQR